MAPWSLALATRKKTTLARLSARVRFSRTTYTEKCALSATRSRTKNLRPKLSRRSALTSWPRLCKKRSKLAQSLASRPSERLGSRSGAGRPNLKDFAGRSALRRGGSQRVPPKGRLQWT